MNVIKKKALNVVFNDDNYLVENDFWTSFNIGDDVYDVNFYVEESDDKNSFITVYSCIHEEDHNYSTDIENPILAIKINDIKVGV